jgi:hypothetical protein
MVTTFLSLLLQLVLILFLIVVCLILLSIINETIIGIISTAWKWIKKGFNVIFNRGNKGE